MMPSTITEDNAQIWTSLKQAIARSSGFQRWQQAQPNSTSSHQNLDLTVRAYLRETLETLAY
ncbi:MAG: hypothetical protein AAGG02_01915 [Cyanobacteria bacterium P01_H01_bin.15]